MPSLGQAALSGSSKVMMMTESWITAMELRQLGNSGLRVSRIGLGCVTFGREIDEKLSFQIMDYAFAQGITLFDTAAAYGDGDSERIIGRWLRNRRCRDQIVLQSKVKPRFTRDHIHSSLENSLGRLDIDRLDIYLLHEFDQTVPLEETMDAMTAAVSSGRVSLIGSSNFTTEQLVRAEIICDGAGFARFKVVQPIYNLLAREIETELIPYCREHAVGIVSYSPLAAGFLTGKYTQAADAIPHGSRFDVKPGHQDLYFRQENFIFVDKLRRLAAQSGISMPRLALGWALRNNDVDSILVGGTSVSHISNAIDALSSGISPELASLLDEWSDSR